MGRGTKADETEEYVASVYRALGFHVERDLLVEGSQTDLVARQLVPGYGPISMLIEVKYRKSTITKREVLEWVNIVQPVVEAGQYSSAVMVVDGRIPNTARLAVASIPRIDVVTLRELEHQLMAPQEALTRFVTEYEARPINRYYIDLEVSHRADLSERAASASESCHCVSGLLQATSIERQTIMLLADYGAGKSTALDRIKYEAAFDYLRNNRDVIPILFKLKERGQFPDLDTFITTTLIREIGVRLPITTFWNLFKEGKFLALLDGFDEISLKTDESNQLGFLVDLAPLLFGECSAILTSRPSYFMSHSDYLKSVRAASRRAKHTYRTGSGSSGHTISSRLARRAEALKAKDGGEKATTAVRPFATYTLDQLTSAQIDEYLVRHGDLLEEVGVPSWQDARAFIDGIYDLSDLMTRPIILEMIVAMLVDRTIDPRSEITQFGAADLYELYCGVKLEVDWEKAPSRKETLSIDDRLKFAEIAALRMQRTGRLEIAGSDLLSMIHDSFPAARSLGGAVTDLRTCSFLTLADDDSLRFIHKSFQEFFFARQLKRNFEQGDERLLRSSLPFAILYFFGSFGQVDDGFRTLMGARVSQITRARKTSSSKEGTLVDNLALAYLLSREAVRDIEWRSLELSHLRTRRLRIERSILTDCHFLNCNLTELDFVECEGPISVTPESVNEISFARVKGPVTLRSSSSMAVGTLAVLESPELQLKMDADAQIGVLVVDNSRLKLKVESETFGGVAKGVEGISVTSSSLVMKGEVRVHLDAHESSISLAEVEGGSSLRCDVTDSLVICTDRLLLDAEGSIENSLVLVIGTGIPQPSPVARRADLRLGHSILIASGASQLNFEHVHIDQSSVVGGSIIMGPQVTNGSSIISFGHPAVEDEVVAGSVGYRSRQDPDGRPFLSGNGLFLVRGARTKIAPRQQAFNSILQTLPKVLGQGRRSLDIESLTGALGGDGEWREATSLSPEVVLRTVSRRCPVLDATDWPKTFERKPQVRR